MTQFSKIKTFCWVAAALLSFACGGHPLITLNDNVGGQGSSINVPTGGAGFFVSDSGAGTGSTGHAGNVGTNCKTTCEPGECGFISDGCGGVIDCKDVCTAPETCGGGGIPFHCGVQFDASTTCVPKTCDQLGYTCGKTSDGCDGTLNCWGADASSTDPTCPDPTMQCIKGTCQTVTATCTKKTCADYAGTSDLCGPVSDGCGGTIDCGFVCSSDKLCGAVQAGKCDKVQCQPVTCESALRDKPAGYCGAVPDGCGGLITNCAATCAGSDTCGGGGIADVCGHGATCKPTKTTADCTGLCGQISDGCGGTIDCGGCTGSNTCGGGGVANVCGAPPCIPDTCKKYNANCGSIADGCGAQLDCGTCTGTDTCGGSGHPNVCGTSTVCVPKTQTELCLTGVCGAVEDGCGNTVDCGGCTGQNCCGCGGTPNVCGTSCIKLTCATVGAKCGGISDGCGGWIDSCGTCAADEMCSGTPSVCSKVAPSCTGIQCNVDHTCATGQHTRLTGKVYAPNGVDPLSNALVYVPNAALPPISSGPSCDRCEDENLGEPIAGALTSADGSFVLVDVPAGIDFPLVVKVGKWRRVVTIPAVTACTNVNLTVDQTRLPRNMTDASTANVPYVNIPHFAIVTGQVDAIECVMRQIGVSDSEFTLPTGTGRIHMYRDNGGTMGCKNFKLISRNTYSTTQCASTSSSNVIQAPLADLFAPSSSPKINEYDVAVMDCRGSAPSSGSPYDSIIHSWANAGGRLFASHYSYKYLYQNSDYANTATWGGPQQGNGNSTTGIVDTTFAKGDLFNTWLGIVGAWSTAYGSGYIDITDPREYVKSVNANTDRFIYTDSTRLINGTQINQTSAVEQYAFNTPYGAASDAICGRVLYSGFHVAGASNLGDKIFPSYCSKNAMTAQEKVLEYMIFDLSSCVSVTGGPPPVTCTPQTCGSLGATCGPVADGCGGQLNCGTCTAPDVCGGGGVANQCGNSCTRSTCGKKGANCGVVSDGCGGTLNCGDCTAPATCGGGGTANICGAPVCIPRSCVDVGAQCGAISDGCGGSINCGTCTAPETCGGGGTPNVCGQGSCNPGTCGTAKCGLVGDGCGGTVSCGTCDGLSCVAGVCTGTTCTKLTCGSATCGFLGDGCGGVLNCGTCTPPQVCGGGGVASQCGGTCTPRKCSDPDVNATCGDISDGCGAIVECGTCPPGKTCGGAGVRNQCGTGVCTPGTCQQVGAECGLIGDGCGNVIECGNCVAPLSCGGGGVANHCGTGVSGCVPRTCAEQHIYCGPAGDGCGGLLDCGNCPPGQTCGGGGITSQCGSIGPIT